MIKRIITLRPLNTKAQEAREWAKELLDIGKRINPSASGEAFIEKYGEAGTLYLITQFDDINQLEERTAITQADEEFQALVTKVQGLFVEGSAKVTLLETF